MYKPGEGWGIETVEVKDTTEHKEEIAELKSRISKLEESLNRQIDKEELN